MSEVVMLKSKLVYPNNLPHWTEPSECRILGVMLHYMYIACFLLFLNQIRRKIRQIKVEDSFNGFVCFKTISSFPIIAYRGLPWNVKNGWNVALVFEVHELFNFVASDCARLLALFKAKKCQHVLSLFNLKHKAVIVQCIIIAPRSARTDSIDELT